MAHRGRHTTLIHARSSPETPVADVRTGRCIAGPFDTGRTPLNNRRTVRNLRAAAVTRMVLLDDERSLHLPGVDVTHELVLSW